jgi:hypothetical protein
MFSLYLLTLETSSHKVDYVGLHSFPEEQGLKVCPHLRDSWVSHVNDSMSLAQDQHPQLIIWRYINPPLNLNKPSLSKEYPSNRGTIIVFWSDKILDFIAPVIVTL